MISEFERYAIDAVVGFYGMDFEPMSRFLDDNVIWSGPRNGSIVVGKDNVFAVFEQFRRSGIRCEVRNVTSRLVSYANSWHLIMVSLHLIAERKEGHSREYAQTHITSAVRCRDRDGSVFWRCNFVHLSNELVAGEPIRIVKPMPSALPPEPDVKKIRFPTENYTYVYLREDEIIRVEGGKNVSCVIHTATETHVVHQLLKDVLEKLPDYYYRCHSSHIVNLRHLKYISARELVLDNGERIPIPEKRAGKIIQEIDSILVHTAQK